MSTRKALSAAAALSAALTLIAVPASAAPTTLAAAEAALTAAQAQVQAVIKDEGTNPGAKWDAQMGAALTAEAAAEAQLRPFLTPPSPCTQCGVIHSFTYRYGNGLTYKVQLAPINGSTNAGPGQLGSVPGGWAGCDRNGLAGDSIMNFSGVCYGSFDLLNRPPGTAPVPGVMINLNITGNGNLVGPRTETIYVNFVTQTTVVGSNGQTYHAVQYRYAGSQQQPVPGRGWNYGCGADFELPAGVHVVQVKWSNLDPNGETTTAVWNV